MKKHSGAILVLLVCASAAFSVHKSDEWIKYTSPEGRYSVSLPAEPKLSTQEATAATGEKFSQYMASVVEPGDIAFLIAYFDSVPGTIFSADAARDAMLRQIKGALISDTVITLDGYPGREFKASIKLSQKPATGEKPAEPVEYILRVRLYEADKRIYLLQFVFPKYLDSDQLAAKATKYFDSFRVIKN